MTPEEFRLIGHQVIDWIADYRTHVAELPVMSTVEPGSIRAQLHERPPEQGEPFAAILSDLDQLIVPGLSHWQHPRFFAYFPANASLASVLGDLLSTGLGTLGLSWQSSPALTELEETVTDWLRQMIGLSDAWAGVIQDSASTATLVALLCARERTSDHGQTRGGLQAEKRPLVVYTSDQSLARSRRTRSSPVLAGRIRTLPTDEQLALRVDALEDAIRGDLAAGRVPCAIVASIGTTASTALDPLEPIAALAGSAMILPECRPLWAGIEGADSLVINPHKWLGAAFDCSLYYVRDHDHLVRAMSTNPSFLRTDADDRVRNLRDWQIPLGRRFRALKLWCLVREQGVAGLQTRLRRDLENARWLTAQVDAAPGWERVAPVPLQTVCVRHRPAELEGEALDAHTLAWVGRVNRSGAAYLTPAVLAGRWMARVSIGAEPTKRTDVEAAWQAMRAEAERR